MAFFILLFILSCTCSYILTAILLLRKSANLPPGPPPSRIIANALRLHRSPHQTLSQLSKIYGPLMHLKLGTVTTIVVSSPELAKQVLQKHDHLLSGRFTQVVSEVDRHNEQSVVMLPAASTRWRVLRRICKEQMFSAQRLEGSQGLRRGKLKRLRDYVQECCDSGRVLDIAEAAFVTSQNLLSETLLSMDLGQLGSDSSSQEFKRCLQGLMQEWGTANLADYFPFLRLLDPQGLNRKAKLYFGSLLRIFDDIIDQRVHGATMDSVSRNDVLDALLHMSRQNESDFTRSEIPHLFLDLFLAGVDTSATTVEWAMAELIHNPEKMAKARNELNFVVNEEGEVEESNISKLPYLQAVVKETLRLHPPGPFLIPHKAEEDTEINGYMVPKNSQVLVNVWGIGRDPSIWSNPNSFQPERFLGSKIDVRGQDFELIPFGSGRRICPGLPLGYRVVHLEVATLIRSFGWKLEHGSRVQDLNMEEKFQFSVKKAVPLKAVPIQVS